MKFPALISETRVCSCCHRPVSRVVTCVLPSLRCTSTSAQLCGILIRAGRVVADIQTYNRMTCEHLSFAIPSSSRRFSSTILLAGYLRPSGCLPLSKQLRSSKGALSKSGSAGRSCKIPYSFLTFPQYCAHFSQMTGRRASCTNFITQR